MNPTFNDEYKALNDLIKYKNYIRYGKDLYSRSRESLKHEYNISEFAWGFCKNPCYAKRLTETLENSVPDNRKFLKAVAKSNNNVTQNKLYPQWEGALKAIERAGIDVPLIVYSTETSHVWNNKTLFCNDIDGEFWHGMLLTSETLQNLDSLKLVISGVDLNNEDWELEYIFSALEVKHNVTQFNSVTPSFFFSPFKHPVVFVNSSLSLRATFSFMDGRLPSDTQIKMVYGVCNCALSEWLKINTLTTQLTSDAKLTIKNGKCDVFTLNDI
jgi:hypothetical protein